MDHMVLKLGVFPRMRFRRRPMLPEVRQGFRLRHRGLGRVHLEPRLGMPIADRDHATGLVAPAQRAACD